MEQGPKDKQEQEHLIESSSEQEELNDLDSTIMEALENLGEVYVNLAGFHAIEEFLCEQYTMSIRFVQQCLSGSDSHRHSNSRALSCDHLTSRRSPARSTFSQSVPKSLRSPLRNGSSRSNRSQIIDQATVREGCSPDPNDSRNLKTIESLCESIDSVLSKAKRVRDKCTTGNVRRKVGFPYLTSTFCLPEAAEI
ncbi:unnamed protein product [Calypogeia fissa]